MPNIKISALPPATTPLDNANTLLETTVLEAGEEVSRRITVSDLVAAISGLDATFLTLSANANLPNERVLTEGTNITFVDTGPNGTLTISASGVSFPLLAPDGLVSAPSYSFASDPDSGMYLNAVGELSFAADGVEIARAINGANLQFAVAQSGGSSVPDLTSLADLDTGFRFPANNQTVWIGGGSRAWNFSTAKFFSQFSNGPALLNEISSDTNPTVVADHADPDTGMGSSGNDELSLIAGGVEGIRIDETAGNVFITYFGPILVPFGSGTQPGGAFDGDIDTGYFRPVDDAFAITAGGVESVRYAELSSQIIQTNSNQVGLTASVTQTQAGGLPLLSSYNEIATVGTTGDALTAFSVVAGTRLTVINNGANDLQLFPDVGDDIGAGVDAAITIAVGDVGIFIGRDATNWDTLFNGPASSGGLSFPILAPDGTAGAPSYSFSGETDLGMFRLAEDFLGFAVNGITRIVVDTSGITGFIGNSGKIVSVGATANFPSVLAANGDTNTGMGWGGIDIVTLAAGGIEGVRYAEDFFEVVQTNSNAVGLVASITQTQAGGTLLRSSYNEIVAVANAGDALTAFSVAAGARLTVINNGANDLQLFPAVGDDFGAGVDTAIVIDSGDVAVFIGRDATDWDTLFNGNSANAGTGGATLQGTWRFDSSTVEADPGTGDFRLDNATVGLTTEIFINSFTRLGFDADNILGFLSSGDQIYIQDRTDASKFLLFDITANVDNGGWYSLAGTVNVSGANFTNNRDCGVVLLFGGTIPGTTLDSTLRFDGTSFVENTLVQMTALGELLTNNLDSLGASFINIGGMDESDPGLNLEDGMSLRFEDRAQTNDFFIQNQGVGAVGPVLYIDGVSTGIVTIGDGLGFRIEDAGNTDWLQMSHDGTHINMGGVNTDALRIEYPILMDEQAAAAADLAGYGQWWVREDVPNTAMFTNDAGVDKSLVNDAVQARRTTDYTLTTAFADVTLDTTDVETDSAVLDHDLVTNTDNIIVGQPGTYEITYGADIDPQASGSENIRAFGRVRINDAGVDIPGSLASCSSFEDSSVDGEFVFGRLQCSFIVTLAASDFLTLQLMQVELDGSGDFTAEEVTVTAKRLL